MYIFCRSMLGFDLQLQILKNIINVGVILIFIDFVWLIIKWLYETKLAERVILKIELTAFDKSDLALISFIDLTNHINILLLRWLKILFLFIYNTIIIVITNQSLFNTKVVLMLLIVDLVDLMLLLADHVWQISNLFKLIN